MVKNGWTSKYENRSYVYGNFPKECSYVRPDSELRAVEIKFEGIEITTVREQKLKRIIQDEKS